jgi:hypothetical protein
MHGVLVLPLLAWLLARIDWPEQHRVRVVWLAITGYAVLAVVVIAESFAGVNPLRAPAVATIPAVLGTLAIAAAALTARPRRP